jgi:hypothetical protein
VHVDENIAIQYVGRGMAVAYDVQNHLGGTMPEAGTYGLVSREGSVEHVPSRNSPQLGLG